ncbi:hypothetical protein [Schleiferilactobacillus shenzhenensis]|nr:hypothetical protein [Schleiferilactobacillus shenzhenensis]
MSPQEALMRGAFQALQWLDVLIIDPGAEESTTYPQIDLSIPNLYDKPEYKNADQIQLTLYCDIYARKDEYMEVQDLANKALSSLRHLSIAEYPIRTVSFSGRSMIDHSMAEELQRVNLIIDYKVIQSALLGRFLNTEKG